MYPQHCKVTYLVFCATLYWQPIEVVIISIVTDVRGILTMRFPSIGKINMSKLTIKVDYGVTPNQVLKDERLSFKAKGLFGYIQSKPHNWKFSATRIASQCSDGVASIKSGLKELEDCGYLIRHKYRTKSGTWSWDYELSDQGRLSTDGLSVDGLSTDGKSANISKKEEVIKNSNKDIDIPLHEFIHFFKDYWLHKPGALYNKQQFSSLWELEENIGKDELGKIIGYVQRIHKENPDYAPKIYSPLQLVDKYPQLIDFAKRQGWEKDERTITSPYKNL